MIYKNLVEKKIFYYDGPLYYPDFPVKTKFEYKVKLKDNIELLRMGTPTIYLEVDVIITKMDAVSAFMFGSTLKNLDNRQKVNDKYWFLATRIADELRDLLEIFDDEVKPVITSIDYIGEIPNAEELKQLIDNPDR